MMAKANPETVIKNRILTTLARDGVRLFNNPVGTGWTGRPQWERHDRLLLHHPRAVTYGLCRGSSDVIGLQSVEITPDMVGRRLAVFVAIEVKTMTGRPSKDQSAFIDMVNALGGVAGIARSVDDADRILQNFAKTECESRGGNRRSGR